MPLKSFHCLQSVEAAGFLPLHVGCSHFSGKVRLHFAFQAQIKTGAPDFITWVTLVIKGVRNPSASSFWGLNGDKWRDVDVT